MIAIGVVCVAAVVLALVRLRGFDWDKFFAAFRNLNWGWLTASALMALGTYVVRAERWRVMIRPICPRASFWGLLVSTAIGFTALVLFGRPGEFVRPYLIATKNKLTITSQVAVWFLERIYDLLIVLVLFGFALTRVQASGASLGPDMRWLLEIGGHIVGIAGTICLVVLIFLRYFSETFRRRITDALGVLPARLEERAVKTVDALFEGVQSARSGTFVLQLVFYSIAEWIVITACFLFLFWSFPDTAAFTLTDVLIFVGFVAIGSVVQIPGIGGGMQVASVIVLSEVFGIGFESASALAILLWAITFLVIVPIGLLLAFHEGLNLRKLRDIEQKSEI
ncbi:MAG TPA: lysylphosphatidylglycerol synthase transmembrane domain-containing protein [Bryobacteraceae bacterium]|nr:lysylphosphatidylglycerol synthase transmembrane domain-containing protein [Bryobacteraceae bacterium]